MGLNRNLGQLTEVIKESGGKIGIGTGATAPVRELEVKGSVQLSNPTGSFILYGYGSTNDFGLGTDTGQSTRDFNLYNYNTTTINLSVNRTTGYLGVGVTSPSDRVTLDGNIKIQSSSAATKSLIFSSPASNWGPQNSSISFIPQDGVNAATSLAINLWDGVGVVRERVRVTSEGRVGIGVANPTSAKLQIDGQDIYLTGNTDNRIRFSNYGFTGNNMGAAIGYIYGVANTQEQGNLAFYTNPNFNGTGSLAEVMRITSGGNIAIGKTVPNSKLDVAGSVIAQGVLIDNTTGNQQLSFRKSGAMRYAVGTEVGDGTTNDWSIYSYVFGGTSFLLYGNNNYKFYGTNVSDSRAKREINDLDFNFLDKVIALRPRSYYMNDDNGRLNYGFIAQEVHEVLPDLIGGDINGDDYIGLDYNGIIPVLVGAIKEQQEIIKQLENRIINLENK